jgi:hypothetical protein
MQKQKLIYVFSPSFSGSTLLTLALNHHPDIASIGELKGTAMGDVSNYHCSCGELLNECRFWSGIAEELSRLGYQFELDNFGTHYESSNWFKNRILGAQIRGRHFENLRRKVIEHWPSLQKEFNSINQLNFDLTRVLNTKLKGEYFLDSSKDPQRLLYLHETKKYDIRVIKMFRNGLAQSNSCRKKTELGMSFVDAVRDWKSTVSQIDRVVRKFDIKNIFSLSYEEFCEAPKSTMDNINEWLDLEPTTINWANLNTVSQSNHVLGNNMRTQKNISIKLDNSWKSEVSKKEQEIFQGIAGKTNRLLGYK